MNKQIDGRYGLSFYFGTLMLLVALASPVAAQTRKARGKLPARTQPPLERTQAQQKAAESADISITATVTARELKFEVVPNPTVEFPGTFSRETVWEAERENLPRPVEPGVIYRNIAVRLVISSAFPDIDRIVSDALGETTSRPAVAPPKRPEPPQPPQPLTPKPTEKRQ